MTTSASTPTFSVCVYCGARPGGSPAYGALADALGTAIGRRGWQLVYGGGRSGLMGRVANATLATGGRVVGVIPQALMQTEVGHSGLSELHVVSNMHERKAKMAEHADAFVAMPGGIGTFEELFEVWTWRHLEFHQCPIGLLDTQGYWAKLMPFLDHAVKEGFMGQDQMAMLCLGDQVDALLDKLASMAKPSARTDLSGI